MLTDALAHLLANTSFAWSRPLPEALRPTNIQWRADACDHGSILFFQRFADGLTDAEIYQRYFAGRRFAALVTNRPLDCFDQLPGVGLYVTPPNDWAEVVRRFCDVVYPLPPGAFRFIGITGTNGKTTTLKYLESILADHGRRVLSIGTLGVFLDGVRQLETGFTSPPLIELRRLLYDYRGRAEVVAMEVSSHALDQGRVAGIAFQDGGWTNFTQDHLDYHRDEESYFRAKARLIEQIQPGGRLYCTSQTVADRLAARGQTAVPVEVLKPARLPPEAIAAKPFLALSHNRANYALAHALAKSELGGGTGDEWRHLQPVPGRFDCYVHGNRTIVIDFAHTPDALDTLLGAIRAGFPGAHIATLFGCGGDRDRSKRPLMGAAVARHSDVIIVTSDNPRHESPERIIEDILIGIPEGLDPSVVVDRAQAIARLFDRLAARPASEPWVAVIAGKGHERYIDRDGHKTPYSDQEQVEANLRRLGWTSAS
ncbi:Mur ligase family protein [Thermochromatium tepidum]|uniref:UDP-N-acetylmuramoyl-L-alanyl-D-glutamate--2, 6-diaminopimelate ligase n=1 Tax=Thermochromatium tepidum ATCC 43061 TaxID=316276 RepID=A0A6I6E6A0_THETI|nr:UDP-N-acetylmuramoyl-L-alanyl-D-glutamate--2,6-diaminopimelate ligase [Thermochromatium tepidum]QGU32028.1 UDP-N-acetylmuramoyl-L-alanyl-D-glutamate--2,6-diaminopimelate ligase [Thermochromatium tepidum ATCC 43061]